jgi:hypothetical protein
MFSAGSTITPPVGNRGRGRGPPAPRRWSRVVDQRKAGVDQLVQVVRRDVGGHADRDAAGAVGQQVGEGRGQHDGFFQRAVVVGAEIDRVFRQPLHQRLGGRRQAGLGVAGGGRVVAVDVAEVALPVDQRVADVEILRQPRHRVIDRGVAVGVVVAHHVARDLGGFAEAPVRGQPQFAHRVKDAPVHRLQPVAGIGQRAVHDGGQRVLQIPLSDRAGQRFGQDGQGGIGGIGHGGCVRRALSAVQWAKG